MSAESREKLKKHKPKNIEEAKKIQVEYFQKGIKQTYTAKVIISDKQNDIAIIQIDDPKFKNLPSIPYVFNTTIVY